MAASLGYWEVSRERERSEPGREDRERGSGVACRGVSRGLLVVESA
jgi:hypothetical protein